MNIKTVTILGANGTMGANVAGIFASFGDAKVFLISRTKKKANEAIEKAVKSVRADAIRNRLIAKDYTEIDKCIANSDLIFESLAEDMKIKKSILNEISEYIRTDAIICTGTSGLSINQLAESLPRHLRKHFIGMHFFNPPYNMSMCELIPSENVSQEMLDKLKEYAEKKLLRTIITIKDQSAFMGNRLGFFLINRAAQLAEKYKNRGGIDYIDAIMGGFSGRNMSPLCTADFVGLDVYKAIVDNIYENINDYNYQTFKLPEYVNKLIKENKLGNKVKEGFYRTEITEKGKKLIYTYDIERQQYRERKKYSFKYVQDMILYLSEGKYDCAAEVLINSEEKEAEICRRLLVEYVLYGLKLNIQIGTSQNDADDAMAEGYAWIPPIAVIEWFGGKEKFLDVVDKLFEESELDFLEIPLLLEYLPKSKYSYEKFLKARG